MTQASSSRDTGPRPQSPLDSNEESAPLIQPDDQRLNSAGMKFKTGTTLGVIRVWWLAFVLNLGGGFLFGYDSGM